MSEFWRVFWNSLSLQASWNGQRMQNLGLLATLVPWARRQRLDVDKRRRFCQRHLGFFNTNPYLAPLVIGGVLRLENDRAGAATVIAFRDAVARACGSLGDQLFWLGLRPALAVLTILLGLRGWWPAVLAVVAAFALGQLALRYGWLQEGYRRGLDVVDLLGHPGWFRAITWSKRAALALTGSLAGVYIAAPGLAIVGIGLPLLLRQRLPGEAQAIIGLAVLWAGASLVS